MHAPPSGITQFPDAHWALGAQTIPHPPQFAVSVCISEQTVPQSVVPFGHAQFEATHEPP